MSIITINIYQEILYLSQHIELSRVIVATGGTFSRLNKK